MPKMVIDYRGGRKYFRIAFAPPWGALSVAVLADAETQNAFYFLYETLGSKMCTESNSQDIIVVLNRML